MRKLITFASLLLIVVTSCQFHEEKTLPDEFRKYRDFDFEAAGLHPLWDKAILLNNSVEVPIIKNGLLARPGITDGSLNNGRERLYLTKDFETNKTKAIQITYLPSEAFGGDMALVNIHNYVNHEYEGKILVRDLENTSGKFEILMVTAGEIVDKIEGREISKEEFDSIKEQMDGGKEQDYWVYYSQETDWYQWNGVEWEYVDTTTEYWSEYVETGSDHLNNYYYYIERDNHGGNITITNSNNNSSTWPSTIVLLNQINGQPISNITNYLKCFDKTKGAKFTLYIDQPLANSSDSWAGPATDPDVGHTFIAIEQNGIKRVLGYYPSEGVNPFYNPSEIREWINDGGHKYDVSISKNISSSQLTQIIDEIKNYSQTYNLNSNNCTDFGMKVAGKAGITLPSAYGSWPGGGGDNPGKLGQIVRNQTINNTTKNLNGGVAVSNSGTCN